MGWDGLKKIGIPQTFAETIAVFFSTLAQKNHG
jgi:hypothetical protein